MTEISIVAKEDQEAIEKARLVYGTSYTFCKLRLFRTRQKAEIEQVKLEGRRKLLREKLQEQDLKALSSLSGWLMDVS